MWVFCLITIPFSVFMGWFTSNYGVIEKQSSCTVEKTVQMIAKADYCMDMMPDHERRQISEILMEMEIQ